MSSIQRKRTRKTEKPVPGCMGRVVNFFDLSAGVAGNRLLTDKSHFDGFGHSRRQSDAMRISPIGDAIDDKVVTSELTKSSSNRNFYGTPVKMLIAEEMSKEVDLNHNSPNLVAKLMGLDSLPQKQPDSVVKRSHSRSHSGSHIGMELDSWKQDHSLEQNGCEEFPDMMWQSWKGHHMKNKPLEGGSCVEASNEKMALVLRKFVEAKRLAANEKLQQSRQFQDALEVLSSNRGLFFKLLQEQDSFSQSHHNLHCVSSPAETKRITVLRPSKMLDDIRIPKPGKMNGKPTKKADDVNRLHKRNHAFSPLSCRLNEDPPPRTRIVVLKPSGKPHNMNAVVSPSHSPSRAIPLDEDMLDSREMAKGIAHLSGHQMEETFASSVFSNGYNGDESSFHKSENEFTLGNLSDSEVETPTSRHSWDYIHKFESPNCSSSFSHASCSPESSVRREAKKRLSERWALMASNGNHQEQKHLRSSSTLGEMLALSDTKRVVKSEEEGTMGEQETRELPLCSSSNLNIDQFVNDSPRNLSRSKSVPASSITFVDSLSRVLDPNVGRADISKEITKTTTPKSSFKEKVSRLFFSRNKRPNKDKSSSFQSEKPTRMLVSPEVVSEAMCKGSCVMEEDPLRKLQGSDGNSSSQDPIGIESKLDVVSPEEKLCVKKPMSPRIMGENQEQPSPISVLEPPFEEDDSITTDSSNVEGDKYGSKQLALSIKSNLIDKSPSIESIARTLTWDDPCLDTATSRLLEPLCVSQGSEEEEQGLLFLVRSLLSAAGFDGEVAPNLLFAKWHSPESPLDQSLRDKYIDVNPKNVMSKAKRRHMTSTAKLVFDCVNTALVEIVDYGLAKHHGWVHGNLIQCAPSLLVDEVWTHVKQWFPCEVLEEFLSDDVDSSSLVVEAMVSKELGSNVWDEHKRLERDNVVNEFAGILLEELVQEFVFEFSGRV